MISVGQITLTDLNDAVISGTAPSNPTIGQLWLDESVNPKMLKKWDGSNWASLGEILDVGTGTTIEQIMTTLGNMANDNLLDFDERKTVKDKLLEIIGNTALLTDITTSLPTVATLDSSLKGEFCNVRRGAVVAGIPTSNSLYTNVATQYNNLKSYLEGLTPIKPWNLSIANRYTNITVAKDTFRTNWLNYYNAVNDLALETSRKLKENADNIEVGGVNIFKTSGNFGGTISNWYNNGGGLTVNTANKYNGYNSIQTTVGAGITGDWYKLDADREYTYSIMVKSTSTWVGNASSPIHYHAGLNNLNEGKIQVLHHNTSYTSTDVGKWKKLWITFKLTSGADSFKPFVYHGTTSTTVMFIAYLKLEKGNKPTDYSPSPEDIKNGFDTINGTLTTYGSSISTLQSEIALRVTSTTYTSGLATKEGFVPKTSTAPSNPANGALWLDTSVTPNILKRWSGTSWVKATPTTASEVGAYSSSDGSALATRVQSAESTITQHANQIQQRVTSTDFTQALNGKENGIPKSNTAPSNPSSGSLWLDTSTTPNVLKRWSGSAWVKATPTTASEVGAYSASEGSALAGRVQTAESTITQQAEQIQQRVTTTTYNAGIASKENAITKANTAPSSPASGALWLNTSVTPNVLNRWNGSSWVKVTPTTAGEVGAYSSSAGSALATRVSTAESTITQQAGMIEQRVTKDGVISAINQTAETIKIQASKINLVGAVTVLSTIAGNLGSITAGSLNIGSGRFVVDTSGNLTATSATISGTITGSEITGSVLRSADKPNFWDNTFLDRAVISAGRLNFESKGFTNDIITYTKLNGFGLEMSGKNNFFTAPSAFQGNNDWTNTTVEGVGGTAKSGRQSSYFFRFNKIGFGDTLWGTLFMQGNSGTTPFVMNFTESSVQFSKPIAPLVHATLSLYNGWSNYGGNYTSASYTKTADGIVTLRGLIRNGATGSIIGYLPIGCRPFNQQMFSTVGGNNASTRIDIDANGVISFISGNTGYVSLDGIVFLGEK